METQPQRVLLQKTFAAESRLTGVRLFVIAVNTVSYSFLMDHSKTTPELAYSVIALAWIYGLYVLFREPYRRYPVLLSSYFTTLTDAALIMVWIHATGGWSSPFYLTVCVSVVAVAFRYQPLETAIAAAVYSGGYIFMLAARGELAAHSAELVIRIAYFVIFSVLGSVFSRELLKETSERARIHGQLAAEEKIRASQAQLAEAQRIAHLGSWEWNLETGDLTWSDEMFRIYGFIPGQIVPSYEEFLARIPPEDHELVTKAVDNSRAKGTPFAFEHRVNRPDGKVRIVRGQGHVIVNEGGKPVRMVGTGQDITEAKQTEELRHRLLEEQAGRTAAELAIHARDDFLSVASHELNTPLTALKLEVQRALLEQPNQQLPEIRSRLDKIERQTKRLGNLVTELLDVSRITAGRLHIELEAVDMVAVIKEAAVRFKTEVERAQCSLLIKTAPSVVGQWDRLRLEQIVDNLLSNAIKYGKGTPINIQAYSQANAMVLKVSDAGIGIAPADQSRIFERFERVVSNQSVGGLGLGLWIVRRVVEALGGEIHVESELNHGSTFVVTLPTNQTLQMEAPK